MIIQRQMIGQREMIGQRVTIVQREMIELKCTCVFISAYSSLIEKSVRFF